MKRLVELVRSLQDPDTGCPWDRAQTGESIGRFLQDEATEVLEAALAEDGAAIASELGDVLFLVASLIEIGQKRGDFTFDDVVDGIVTKMHGRHPHVFGPDARQVTIEEAEAIYQEAKRIERARASNA